jgi:GTP cyclohydrolase I
MRQPFDEEGVRAATRALLLAFGEDPEREGLRETPDRIARFYREWFCPEPLKFTTFDNEGHDEMIVQEGIPFAALCEHHGLPFVGQATVAYIPDRRIVGLSKLARVVHHCSAGLQNQERVTGRVACYIEEHLRPKGVAVMVRAEHLCMAIRGVRAAGAATTTSDLRGVFRDGPARAEFLALAGRGRR